MILKIKKLHDLAQVPTYADIGSSGFDLYSTEKKVLYPGSSEIISTGIAFEIPLGYEVQIRGRSGLAFKEDVIAHFGTIDSSYRGEIKVKLFNLSRDYQFIEVGDRIAQGVLAPILKADFVEVGELTSTDRGNGGFGHTGK